MKNNKLLYYDVDNKRWSCIMKAHKYWSIGAIVTMVGTFYTGYKGLKMCIRDRNSNMKLQETQPMV